jgi:hypothetical protein
MADPLNPSTIDAKLKAWRLLHFALAASLVVCMCGIETVVGPGYSDWTIWHWLIAGLAVYTVAAGFFLRRRLLRLSEKMLAKSPPDPEALQKWQAAQVLGIAFAGGVAQYGLILRIALRSTFWQVSLFYAVGLLLLLLWRPQGPRFADSHS